jgi:hypothetical protein
MVGARGENPDARTRLAQRRSPNLANDRDVIRED